MIKQIYEQVLDQIEADVYQRMPGEYLPSEVQYALSLSVSRITVRKAVDELVQRGLITRIAGKGIMVRDGEQTRPKGRLLISCICLPGDSDLFRCVLGAVEAAGRLGYEYKLLNYPTAAEQYRAVLAEDLSAYDGAILTCFDSEADLSTLSLIRRAGFPFVIVCNEHEGEASVMGDDYNGGYLIADHLVKHGHTRILYLSTDRRIQDVPRRLSGFVQGLADNGVEADPELVLEVPDPGVPLLTGVGRLRDLPFAAEKFISRQVAFTAIAGHSTLPIISLCNHMHRAGVRIPEDVSVVAYGDQPYLPWLNLPLSGIVEPKYEIGEEAVIRMHEYLTGITDTLESRILPVRFVRRQSVRPLHPA